MKPGGLLCGQLLVRVFLCQLGNEEGTNRVLVHCPGADRLAILVTADVRETLLDRTHLDSQRFGESGIGWVSLASHGHECPRCQDKKECEARSRPARGALF